MICFLLLGCRLFLTSCFPRFDQLVSFVSDPAVLLTTGDCLEQLHCTIDPEIFLSAYVVACFPEKNFRNRMLLSAAQPMLGAFEVLICSAKRPLDRHAAFLREASVYAGVFCLWKECCIERYGFWVESCDALRLVVDHALWSRGVCCT